MRLADEILEKISIQASQIRELERLLREAEDERIKAERAWGCLCQLFGQHLEVSMLSFVPGIMRTVTVTLTYDQGLLSDEDRRRRLVDVVGPALGHAIQVKLAAGTGELRRSEGDLLKAIPVPVGRHCIVRPRI